MTGIDWTGEMGRSYELWFVDPSTWLDARPVAGAVSGEITRDISGGGDDDLLTSAKLELLEPIEGEAYLRAYMRAEQPAGSGRAERVCLDTFLVQAPKATYGSVRKDEATCYGPLIELRDDGPPAGWTLSAGSNVRKAASQLCRAHCRAPVAANSGAATLSEPFVAAGDDTWLTFLRALLRLDGLSLSVDPLGRIAFVPDRDASALTPSWTYRDDDRSVMLPDVSDDCDWMGLPNTYKVVVSGDAGCVAATAVNDSPSSPISTVARGRVVSVRDASPDLPSSATEEMAEAYARKKLREGSRTEHSVTFSHLFNEVRAGEAVELDYTRHGLRLRAKVVRQQFALDTACVVDETATYSTDYWR